MDDPLERHEQIQADGHRYGVAAAAVWAAVGVVGDALFWHTERLGINWLLMVVLTLGICLATMRRIGRPLQDPTRWWLTPVIIALSVFVAIRDSDLVRAVDLAVVCLL